jgi:hypothetical protein
VDGCQRVRRREALADAAGIPGEDGVAIVTAGAQRQTLLVVSGPVTREESAMAARRRVYRTFHLRIWRTADGEERIKIEQNHTGETA